MNGAKGNIAIMKTTRPYFDIAIIFFDNFVPIVSHDAGSRSSALLGDPAIGRGKDGDIFVTPEKCTRGFSYPYLCAPVQVCIFYKTNTHLKLLP
jgi:hypothetical protein